MVRSIGSAWEEGNDMNMKRIMKWAMEEERWAISISTQRWLILVLIILSIPAFILGFIDATQAG